ncbi:hypothetical protein PUN28_019239 [Cardiocondyla obscurior]|uniref:CHK kinase-like domain-containing protein n=1 Tax=Cardiocondyla obscurior TaxID=286306 RepID=A0AAW2EG01_9HYME
MYAKGMFSEGQPQDLQNFFVMGVKALGDEVATWPGMEKYAEKILKLSDHIYKIGTDANKFSEHDFNVINHGDFWVNNMLFKYDSDGKPIQHICVSIIE